MCGWGLPKSLNKCLVSVLLCEQIYSTHLGGLFVYDLFSNYIGLFFLHFLGKEMFVSAFIKDLQTDISVILFLKNPLKLSAF